MESGSQRYETALLFLLACAFRMREVASFHLVCDETIVLGADIGSRMVQCLRSAIKCAERQLETGVGLRPS